MLLSINGTGLALVFLTLLLHLGDLLVIGLCVVLISTSSFFVAVLVSLLGLPILGLDLVETLASLLLGLADDLADFIHLLAFRMQEQDLCVFFSSENRV